MNNKYNVTTKVSRDIHDYKVQHVKTELYWDRRFFKWLDHKIYLLETTEVVGLDEQGFIFRSSAMTGCIVRDTILMF